MPHPCRGENLRGCKTAPSSAARACGPIMAEPITQVGRVFHRGHPERRPRLTGGRQRAFGRRGGGGCSCRDCRRLTACCFPPESSLVRPLGTNLPHRTVPATRTADWVVAPPPRRGERRPRLGS